MLDRNNNGNNNINNKSSLFRSAPSKVFVPQSKPRGSNSGTSLANQNISSTVSSSGLAGTDCATIHSSSKAIRPPVEGEGDIDIGKSLRSSVPALSVKNHLQIATAESIPGQPRVVTIASGLPLSENQDSSTSSCLIPSREDTIALTLSPQQHNLHLAGMKYDASNNISKVLQSLSTATTTAATAATTASSAANNSSMATLNNTAFSKKRTLSTAAVTTSNRPQPANITDKNKRHKKNSSKLQAPQEASVLFPLFPPSFGSIDKYSKHTVYVKLCTHTPTGSNNSSSGSGGSSGSSGSSYIEGIRLENVDNRAVVSAITVSELQPHTSEILINDVIFSVNSLDARYASYEQVIKALTRVNHDNYGGSGRVALSAGVGAGTAVGGMSRVAMKNSVIDSIACVVFIRALTEP